MLSNRAIYEKYYCANGDPETLSDLRLELFEQSSFIIENRVERYKGLEDYKDLKQIAYFTLFKAIRTFDPNKSKNYYKWVYQWINKEVAVAAKRSLLYHSAIEIPDDCRSYFDGVSGESDLEGEMLARERIDFVNDALGLLSKKSRYIIKNVFELDACNKSLRSMGKHLGAHHSKVMRIRDEAFEQLSRNRHLEAVVGA